LWHARQYLVCITGTTIQYDTLCSVGKKILNPLENIITHSIERQFLAQSDVGDSVKGFGHVKEYGINFITIIQCSGKIVNDINQLCFAGSSFSKTVLGIMQDGVGWQVCVDTT